MTIINISLAVIFFCLAFIVLSNRIKMEWFAKSVMCLMMISIVGAWASINTDYQKFYDISWNLFFSCLAFIACFVTYKANKRGYY